MKKKPGQKKSEIWKILFPCICIVLAAACIFQLFTVELLPIKYACLITAILIGVLYALFYIQFSKHIDAFNRLLGKVVLMVVSVILGYGNWYIYKSDQAIRKVSDAAMNTSIVSVVVLQDSEIKTMKDLEGKRIGTITIGDNEIQNMALDDIKKDLQEEINTLDYQSYPDYADALYDGTIDAMLVNESSRDLLKEVYENFDEETRILTSYTYHKETKDIRKKVEVLNSPFNVYITGIDVYGDINTVSRSDVNMIASINPNTNQILLISIPRDYYVVQQYQGNQRDKLTHAGIFGVESVVQSAENLMGMEMNYYVRVNFSSVVDIVDALGGIEVYSPYEFTCWTDSSVYIQQGDNVLNGKETLAFVRERYALPNGDRDRGKNQMRVIKAMITKAISPAIITRYGTILDAISDSFQTNMSQDEINDLIRMQLDQMNYWDIFMISLNGYGATEWSPANGFYSYVMVPDEESVSMACELMEKIMANEVILQDDIDAYKALYDPSE